MTTKTKKRKVKPRRPSKAKLERRTVALVAETATVRKSKPIREKATRASVARAAGLWVGGADY